MTESERELELKERILKTIRIVDRRGYSLSLDKLSEDLIGGCVDSGDLRNAVESIEDVEFDGTFVGLPQRLNSEKCSKRMQENSKHYERIMSIASDYSRKYVRLNPWVKCIMVTGSLASGGFCEGDDIDLNIIVNDDSKYTSYLLALLLGLPYSLIHGRKFKEQYLPGIPKVICINVVWEAHQALPFERQDGQVAFELLNSKVIFNSDYFKSTMRKNGWIEDWFPQLFHRQNGDSNFTVDTQGPGGNGNHQRSPRLLESLTKKALFSLFHLVRFSRTGRSGARKRMEFVESAKYPYGIFDEPRRNKQLPRIR